MAPDQLPRKLWEHPDPQSTAMWKFMQQCNERYGLQLKGFDDLYRWSCAERSQFYGQLWDAQRWIHEGAFTRVVDESMPVSRLPRWFAGVRLNWAENFLWRRADDDGPDVRGTRHKDDGRIALTEVREGSTHAVDVSWAQLRARVARLASAMRARGVAEGHRVAIVAAHACETLVVMLATAWLGAIFTTNSTDMGIDGLLQRLVQINPTLVFFDDASLYNGRTLDLRCKMRGMVDGLAACDQFKALVAIQRFPGAPYDTSAIPKTERLEHFLEAADAAWPPIQRVAFQDPMAIYYSSGTTGTPKAIVHAVGPLLMNLHKELSLHLDAKTDDVGLQYTTSGWIVQLSSVSFMITGRRAVLYDGSPFLPDPALLLRMAEQQGVTILGISPRWMMELMRRHVVPRETADLSRLRVVLSTGMVLPDQLFTWFYDVAFAKHVQLNNVTGGTDIAGGFGMGNPLKPVYVGGCVGPSLGVPIAVFDHDKPNGSDCAPVPDGTAGDLVATGAFPNVPIFLWGDTRPAPGAKYRAAYFERFRDVWTHGDFCAMHPQTRSLLTLGRSDGVLNPSGIRFGSADIYAVVERCFEADVSESLCVGQRRARDQDEAVVLFLVMKPGRALDRAMVRRVKDAIANGLTKRHVPKYVFEVPEVPVNSNGKKMELPVKSIISGKPIKANGTLLNPRSLDFFYRFQKIEDLAEPAATM